jgi:hypothetical protein
MARNPIQFQKGLSLIEFNRRYGTEEQCHAALVKMRWPDGFMCPHCGGDRAQLLRGPADLPMLCVPRADLGAGGHDLP